MAVRLNRCFLLVLMAVLDASSFYVTDYRLMRRSTNATMTFNASEPSANKTINQNTTLANQNFFNNIENSTLIENNTIVKNSDMLNAPNTQRISNLTSNVTTAERARDSALVINEMPVNYSTYNVSVTDNASKEQSSLVSSTARSNISQVNASQENVKTSTEKGVSNMTFALIPSSITYSTNFTSLKTNLSSHNEQEGSSLQNLITNHSLAAIPSNITFSVVPTDQRNAFADTIAKNQTDMSPSNSAVSLTIPTNKVFAAVPSNITFSTVPQTVDIAAIDIKGKTATLEENFAENITKSLNESDVNATVPPTTTPVTTTKSNQKQADDASRSEIYKMKNNGLMLLHAQRAKSGSEAKKSELIDNLNSASVNYHVRKRTNSTEGGNQNEKDNSIESTLSHIPRVLHKRSLGNMLYPPEEVPLLKQRRPKNQRLRKRSLSLRPTISMKRSNFFINASPVPFLPELRSPCKPNDKRHYGCRKTKTGKKYRSVIQGENDNGGKLKRDTLIPRKARSIKVSSPTVTDDNIMYGRTYSLLTVGSMKHKRLKRALQMMSVPTINPDSQYSKRVRRNVEYITESVARDTIEAIPTIPKIESLNENMVDENSPFNGELTLEQFHRLPTPSMEAFLKIDKIPPAIGNEKEETPSEISEYIEATPPPPIKDISDIAPLTDIQSIKSVQLLQDKDKGLVKDLVRSPPVPIKDTLKTKYGVVTRVII